MNKIKPPEITPEELYLNRREFIRRLGLAAAGVGMVSPTSLLGGDVSGKNYSGSDEKLTAYESIISYNNFYEFSTDKEEVQKLTDKFITSPWEFEVTGLVENPGKFKLAEVKNQYEQEERIYRLRCVEGWSMVIPWTGFPLAALLNDVKPKPEAKFVRFTSVLRPKEMPGQKGNWYEWPYVEGLRIDEAMNNLTLLATGLYGKDMPIQNGAPIRLVVPWKYGFKSIKSIVKIELVDEMPLTFWMKSAPKEYGFYSNVNPKVSHPRWSQASERRIGEFRRRKTMMFNGYEDEVAHLYSDMNLKKYF